MKIQEGLLYSREHEWARRDGGAILVGITDFAQDHLGDIVYVEIPEIGKHVQIGDVLCVVESVKAVADIYAPVSGTVLEVNEDLDTAPERLNQDPYGNFIAKVSIEDERELSMLLSPEAYKAFCQDQGKEGA
ncbi:MAG: glycine cleavage system protein GcvH [Syntrophales bacterium]